MKHLLACILLCCIFSVIHAQQEEAPLPLSKTEWSELFDQLHREQEPRAINLKWNAAALLPFGNGDIDDQSYGRPDNVGVSPVGYASLSADLELKLTPWLSLNGGIDFISGRWQPDVFLYAYIPKPEIWSMFRIEPRLYWKQWRGRRPGNLNGPYLGLEYASGKAFNSDEILMQAGLPLREDRFLLRAGLQHRLMRYGYLDLAYALGWRTGTYRVRDLQTIGFPIISTTRRQFLILPQINAGFSLVPSKEDRAAVLKSYQNLSRRYSEKKMWRIGLTGLINLADPQRWRSEIPVNWEYRLGNSGFSLNLESRVRFSWYTQFQEPVYASETTYKSFGAGAAFEIRNYPGLRDRVMAGKSGLQCSGFYWAVKIRFDNDWILGVQSMDTTGKMYIAKLSNQRYSIASIVGFQYRITPVLYLGYQAGGRPSLLTRRYSSKPYSFTTNEWHINWFSELSIGLAF